MTPFFLSLGTSALAVSTSSAKSISAMPAGLTIVSVFSRVMPMKAIFWPSLTFMIFVAGKTEPFLAGSFHFTLAPR